MFLQHVSFFGLKSKVVILHIWEKIYKKLIPLIVLKNPKLSSSILFFLKRNNAGYLNNNKVSFSRKQMSTVPVNFSFFRSFLGADQKPLTWEDVDFNILLTIICMQKSNIKIKNIKKMK